MKKDIKINQKIKHFSEIFNKRTYKIFQGIIKGILFLRNWRLSDLANVWDKSLRQVEYFFNWAKWHFKKLNKFMIRWIRNKKWCWDKKSDVLIFDWSVFKKNLKSVFSWLTWYFWSNRDKKVVNWFELFWASIMTTSWAKYILDIMLYYKKKIKKWKNLKSKLKSELMNCRRKFMARVCNKSKAWIVLLDSGFKWWNICKWIKNVLKKHFLVRIDHEQFISIGALGLKYKNKKLSKKQNSRIFTKISKILKKDDAIAFKDGRLWFFENAYIKSWLSKWVDIPVNIIIFWKNWFRYPMVLATSSSLSDVYENMIRKPWKPSWNEKIKEYKTDYKNNSRKLWICFFNLYSKRWSIEVYFKEMKSYLCFEDFKVLSYDSIMKYLHIIILTHTLLFVMLSSLFSDITSYYIVYDYLKKKRNIKNNEKKITIVGLKLFLELIFQNKGCWLSNNICSGISQMSKNTGSLNIGKPLLLA